MVEIDCYRYEDSNGYGPYYNERKHIYNWSDDGWRHACDSLEKLKEWWSNNQDISLENYHVVRYLVKLDEKAIIKAKETHMIDFKLTNVINKEDIE